VNAIRPFSTVLLKWLPIGIGRSYPKTERFACTGYREREGFEHGLFSIFVDFALPMAKPMEGEQQAVRIFALSSMRDSWLPVEEEIFVITAGALHLASGVTISRGESILL
jgi:hypothetical protein